MCRRLATVMALAGAMVVQGCSFAFQKPAANSAPTVSPVDVEVTWNADAQHFKLMVDGADSTSALQVNGRKATGPLNLAVGSHTLTAGGEIYCWYCSPKWYPNTQVREITIQAKSLSFAGAPFVFQVGSQQSVTISRNTSAGALTVSVTSSNGGVASVTNPANGMLTIADGQTQGTVTLSAGAIGTSTLTASAPGYTDGTSNVTITAAAPTITSLSPSSGPVGQTVTIAGANFAPGAQVRFGSTNVATAFLSASQLSAAVPALAPGQVNVTVAVGAQTSNALAFTVLAPPPDLVVRASSGDVQVYDMASTPPHLVSAKTATLSPGGVAGSAVALSGGAGRVFRASTSDIQAFSVSAAGVLGAPVSIAANMTTAVGITSSGGTVLRGTDSGADAFQFNGSSFAPAGMFNGTPGSGGVAVAISGTTAVRSTGPTLEVLTVSNGVVQSAGAPVAPSSSSTGVALVFVTPTRIARAFSGGLELFDVGSGTAVRAGQPISGQGSSASVGLALTGTGRLVRATSQGIEVYSLSGNTLSLLGSRNGDLSSTGVGVTTLGNFAYRSTDDAIERYDISNPSSIPAPVTATAAQHGVTMSSTGTGIVKP